MSSKNYMFRLEFQVRDYECDIQGIVNNGTYQNYLEHARHEFLNHIGFDFADMHKQGRDAMVIKSELEYKYPLRPRDRFEVCINVVQEGNLKFVFLQHIYRIPDAMLILKAKITGIVVENGRPRAPEDIIAAVQKIKVEL